jgi:hypothetical protein
MLEFKGGAILRGMRAISALEGAMHAFQPDGQQDDEVATTLLGATLDHARTLLEVAKTLEAAATEAAAQRLVNALVQAQAARLSLGAVSRLVAQVTTCLPDEFEGRKAFIMTPEEARLYEPAEPIFGEDVAIKFCPVTYDITEAAKCLAFGRSTASAFHSIRCLEAAILAISRCLDINDPIKAADRNWGAMLRLIKGDIDRRWPTSTHRLKGDGQIFDELYGSLAAMQNPYRNSTMHLDKKYTEGEARHVFRIVCGFMRRVAFRMDEKGEPRLP